MNALVMIARILLGLIFTVFGLDYFLHFMPELPVSEAGGKFLEAIFSTGYLFPAIKVIETGAGLLLLSGFATPLALALLAPIVTNIALYHFFLDPNGIVLATAVVILEVGLVWAYRDSYKGLFEARRQGREAFPVVSAPTRAELGSS